MTLYPSLRVSKGRVRSFPVSVRHEDARQVLVLNLKESEVVIPETGRRKKQAESKQDEPKKAEPEANQGTPAQSA